MLKFKKGQKVRAYNSKEKKWQSATIIIAEPGRVRVRFKDGREQDTPGWYVNRG